MEVIACDQFGVLGDECPECGGWLHCERPGGYPAQVGFVCTEECAANQSVRLAEGDREQHLRMRDLLCDCARFCAPAGLPNAAMRTEYARWQDAEQRARERGVI